MRDIPVGNGSLLVTFDDKYQIRDIFFPHVGQENQTEGHPFRFGVWIDGNFSWVASDDWERRLEYLDETLVTRVTLRNESLGIEITCHDTVASHENIFLREMTLQNLAGTEREVRLFLHHDFRLYENKVGDTAYFDPVSRALIHYQKRRYFLVGTEPGFESFATGRKDFNGHEGTWRDAEDGDLQGGPITEGSVDSTVGIHFRLDARGTSGVHYWIAAGDSRDEVIRLNDLVLSRGPRQYLKYTANYWRAWVNKDEKKYAPLPDRIVEMLKRSLLIIHTQIDSNGAILAANDWDVTLRATDHYSYLWTRDGAFVANALDLAGFSHLSRTFFYFCGEIVHPDGYFLQKYNADGTVASGWHSAWNADTNEPVLPIQEDETALVLWALWEHYDKFRDIEFAHRLYKKLVIPCADFMEGFIEPELGLPMPSWNLWEDRRGIHTFTCSAVVAGLKAAASFAELFAERERAEKYRSRSNSIVAAMKEHLYSKDHGRFLRALEMRGSDLEPDPTIDASLFGTFYLGCLSPDDKMVEATMLAVENKLHVNGGIARFENDGYMRVSDEVPGNAWFICTLWLAEYYIAKAKNKEELAPATKILEWVVDQALPSGVLAEQLDPTTGGHISVSPLTWSHSTFVAAALHFLKKIRSFERKSSVRAQ